jgi:hypothetical protein
LLLGFCLWLPGGLNECLIVPIMRPRQRRRRRSERGGQLACNVIGSPVERIRERKNCIPESLIKPRKSLLGAAGNAPNGSRSRWVKGGVDASVHRVFY